MTCLDWEGEIGRLLDGRLPEREQEAVLAHLDTCLDCQQQIEASLREPTVKKAMAILRPSQRRTREYVRIAAEQVTPSRKGILAMLGRTGFRIVAAAVVVLIVTGIWYGTVDGPDPYASYAEMLAVLDQVTSVQFVRTNNHGVKSVHYQRGDGTWRREDSTAGGYQATGIYDGKSLAWFAPAKKFVDIQHSPNSPGFEPAPFWQAIREKIDKNGENRFLGKRQIDGKTALGYEVKLADQGAFTERVEEIWIEEATRLPLLVESRSVFCYASLIPERLEKEKSRLAELVRKGVMRQKEADQQIANNMKPVKVVETYTDFRWNIVLDEAIFRIVVPEGWTVQEVDHRDP